MYIIFIEENTCAVYEYCTLDPIQHTHLRMKVLKMREIQNLSNSIQTTAVSVCNTVLEQQVEVFSID